ncbi:pantetheine-phosphate adenylyltransferase [Mycoplasma sp. CB776]
MNKAIFAGSFDPFHEGHLNILQKALKVFDFIYVVITRNPDKKQISSFQEKKSIVQQKIDKLKNVEILINDKELTAEFAKKLDVKFLIRAARNDIDFSYELELAYGNKEIYSELETIVFFPDEKNREISSTLERHKKIYDKGF